MLKVGRWAVVALAATLSLAGAGTPAARAADTASLLVQITDQGFVPQQIQIAKGAGVAWRNVSGQSHAVKSEAGVWDSGEIQPDSVYELVFQTPGTYSYVDPLNANVRAWIVVGSGGSVYGTEAPQVSSPPSGQTSSGSGALTPISSSSSGSTSSSSSSGSASSNSSSSGLVATGGVWGQNGTGQVFTGGGANTALGGYSGYNPGSSGQVGYGGSTIAPSWNTTPTNSRGYLPGYTSPYGTSGLYGTSNGYGGYNPYGSGYTNNGLYNNGVYNNGVYNNGLYGSTYNPYNNGVYTNNGLYNNGVYNNGVYNNGLYGSTYNPYNSSVYNPYNSSVYGNGVYGGTYNPYNNGQYNNGVYNNGLYNNGAYGGAYNGLTYPGLYPGSYGGYGLPGYRGYTNPSTNGLSYP